MIVTIDGPSGTGKSTVAREVAKRLGFVYFDTGAMYRAFTWFVMEHSGVPIPDLLDQFTFHIEETPKEKRYYVNDREVTEVIRSRSVTARVSEISALKEVRAALLEVQREFGRVQNAVFEGRDIGSVVFPQAEVKIFLTADPKIRAERRFEEMRAKNPEEANDLDREVMLAEIIERDRYDSSRELAPLRCPEGAFTIDTTHLSIETVVEKILDFFSQKKSSL